MHVSSPELVRLQASPRAQELTHGICALIFCMLAPQLMVAEAEEDVSPALLKELKRLLEDRQAV